MANKEVEFPVWALIMCPSCGEELEYVGIRRKGKQIKLAWTHPEPHSASPKKFKECFGAGCKIVTEVPSFVRGRFQNPKAGF